MRRPDSRNVVETAIDLAKKAPKTTWSRVVGQPARDRMWLIPTKTAGGPSIPPASSRGISGEDLEDISDAMAAKAEALAKGSKGLADLRSELNI